ncbi:hypothetical protein P9305_09000 [Lysinibacillus capsici]|uniref:hypothetical protein n=1 Tax=Lysinibacillus capsici TaxID=2115968 RepID=UPI0028E49450|nr:hypothetical protein [Lysinibacillus capsici]MED4552858.1 hypothetical protein [Lysinibacillus capsici]
MASPLKPEDNLLKNKKEGLAIIHDSYTRSPAIYLLNGTKAYEKTSNYEFVNQRYDADTTWQTEWTNVNHFLDIEFFQRTIIWENGSFPNNAPLYVYSFTNRVLGEKVTTILPPSTSGTWSKTAEVPKGRYKISCPSGSRGIGEWYFENADIKRIAVQNENKYYSISDKTLIHLPNDSDKNMILYGIEQGEDIQLDVPFDKMKYVQDTSEEIGNGKVFRKAIESTQVPIKKASINTEKKLTVISETNNKSLDLIKIFSDNITDTYKSTITNSWVEIDVKLEKVALTLESVDVYIDNSSNANQPYGFEILVGGVKIAERLSSGTGGSFWDKSSTTNIPVPFEKQQINRNSIQIRILASSDSRYPLIIPHITFYGTNNNHTALIFHNNAYKKYDSLWKVVTSTTPTEVDYLNGNTVSELSKIPISAWQEINGTIELFYYTNDSNKSEAQFDIETEPFSVYDYIGELPTVIAYTESTDDIIVSTTTEPFDVYDEFGDTVDVLYYTNDEAVSSSDLIVDANWTPIDELDGDIEVVTWTDEAPETAQRALEMKAIPKPQFIKLVNPKRVYGYLEDVLATDISQTYRDEARYFVTGSDTSNWYVWDKETETFIVKDTSTEQTISANGMKYNELNAITDKQWKTWISEYLNIGVFLKDNPRDTIISVVESVSYKDFLPRNTSTISNTSLYILNTTAKIDLQLNGNLLTGVLSDKDLTRVQYRVSLNGQNYYPNDGSWTKLGSSPQNIAISFSSNDIKIDDWNTVKVEFRDFYGTIDYWQNQFVGTYSGLMFKDVYGQYYSSEIGEVLNYLDFGVIIAGQTTIEHEIILKNQYGYDVKDIQLYANTSNFPTGMVLEFSDSLSPFSPQPELSLNRTLTNNEEMSFFIRLKTELGATPDANGSFDIIVRAEKA